MELHNACLLRRFHTARTICQELTRGSPNPPPPQFLLLTVRIHSSILPPDEGHTFSSQKVGLRNWSNGQCKKTVEKDFVIHHGQRSAELIKKFKAFDGTRRFITVFTKALFRAS
jgi:hypothetical protein